MNGTHKDFYDIGYKFLRDERYIIDDPNDTIPLIQLIEWFEDSGLSVRIAIKNNIDPMF
jgi:hypothetical protein